MLVIVCVVELGVQNRAATASKAICFRGGVTQKENEFALDWSELVGYLHVDIV